MDDQDQMRIPPKGDIYAAETVTRVNKTPSFAVTGGNEMPSSAVTGKNETPSSIGVLGEMDMENAVTGGNEMPSSAVTGKNETASSIGVPGEMDTKNAVTGGNETPTPSSEEKVKEIPAEIKTMREQIAVCTESPETMMDMQTERITDEKSNVLKRKHDDQQGVETFKEDVDPMTAKKYVKDSSEASALTGSVPKLDLKSVSAVLQEETEKQKSDSGKKKRNIKQTVRMMTALRGSSCHSDSDDEVFRRIIDGFDDHFREFLCQAGVLGSTEATEGGGKKEINTESVIQSFAKRQVKEMQLIFFGSKSVSDPSDELDAKTIQMLEVMENRMCNLYRQYLAEESEKNKMVNNDADVKRKKTENIDDCDVKRSSLEKGEGSQE